MSERIFFITPICGSTQSPWPMRASQLPSKIRAAILLGLLGGESEKRIKAYDITSDIFVEGA